MLRAVLIEHRSAVLKIKSKSKQIPIFSHQNNVITAICLETMFENQFKTDDFVSLFLSRNQLKYITPS